MVEGQEGVGWRSWNALAELCERYGFHGIFTSDHYASASNTGALDAWTILAALAARTERIRLGSLVSPCGFRHPSVLAKCSVTVDHISNGRVELGLGAGWDAREHAAYGFPFADASTRWDIVEEQLQIIRGHWERSVYSFMGTHYVVDTLDARPKPVQEPGPPIIIGGTGRRRSVALAAAYASEYNTFEATTDDCATRAVALREACRAVGRDPSTLRLSLMTTCILEDSRDAARVRQGELSEQQGASAEEFDGRWLVGTPSDVVAELSERSAAGVARVMLSVHHEDLATVERIGETVIPAVASL